MPNKISERTRENKKQSTHYSSDDKREEITAKNINALVDGLVTTDEMVRVVDRIRNPVKNTITEASEAVTNAIFLQPNRINRSKSESATTATSIKPPLNRGKSDRDINYSRKSSKSIFGCISDSYSKIPPVENMLFGTHESKIRER